MERSANSKSLINHKNYQQQKDAQHAQAGADVAPVMESDARQEWMLT